MSAQFDNGAGSEEIDEGHDERDVADKISVGAQHERVHPGERIIQRVEGHGNMITG